MLTLYALLTHAQCKTIYNMQHRSASMSQISITIYSKPLRSCHTTCHLNVEAISCGSGSLESIPLLLSSAELSEKLGHPAALCIPCLNLNHLHTPCTRLQPLETVCAAMQCTFSHATAPFVHDLLQPQYACLCSNV